MTRKKTKSACMHICFSMKKQLITVQAGFSNMISSNLVMKAAAFCRSEVLFFSNFLTSSIGSWQHDQSGFDGSCSGIRSSYVQLLRHLERSKFIRLLVSYGSWNSCLRGGWWWISCLCSSFEQMTGCRNSVVVKLEQLSTWWAIWFCIRSVLKEEFLGKYGLFCDRVLIRKFASCYRTCVSSSWNSNIKNPT